MKNQYFGDISDYHKYGLLRILSGSGALRMAVCWMLTADDLQGHGQNTGYLQARDRWRAFDPELFDSLARSLASPEARHVRWAEMDGLLPSAVYYDPLLTDVAVARRRYFEDFRTLSQSADLVFFDPDNGLEVASVRLGKRGSSKYLYWDEVRATFGSGQSVLIYQHFPRQSRRSFTDALAQELLTRTGATGVMSFRTAHVVFLLAAQERHMDHFRRVSERVGEVWRDHIHVSHHVVAAPLPDHGATVPLSCDVRAAAGQPVTLQVVLGRAAKAVAAGGDSEARSLLQRLQSPPSAARSARVIPREVQLRIFLRDNFCCSYCGKKTLFIPVLRALSHLYPEYIPYHLNWKWSDCHPVYWTHGTSCDHLVAAARGGSSEPENLVTACYMCNSIKQNWLLEELGWTRQGPSDTTWDGLSALYPALCSAASLRDHAYHRPWLLASEKVQQLDTSSPSTRS